MAAAGDAGDPRPRAARRAARHDPALPDLLGDLRRRAEGAPRRDPAARATRPSTRAWPARPVARARPGTSSAVPAGRLRQARLAARREELLARAGVVAQSAVQRRGDGPRARLLHAAQRHAQVLGLEHDADALRAASWSCSQSATCLVSRSWTCRPRANSSTTRASLDSPRMRVGRAGSRRARRRGTAAGGARRATGTGCRARGRARRSPRRSGTSSRLNGSRREQLGVGVGHPPRRLAQPVVGRGRRRARRAGLRAARSTAARSIGRARLRGPRAGSRGPRVPVEAAEGRGIVVDACRQRSRRAGSCPSSARRQGPQAVAILGAGRAALEVRAHAGHGGVRVARRRARARRSGRAPRSTARS